MFWRLNRLSALHKTLRKIIHGVIQRIPFSVNYALGKACRSSSRYSIIQPGDVIVQVALGTCCRPVAPGGFIFPFSLENMARSLSLNLTGAEKILENTE